MIREIASNLGAGARFVLFFFCTGALGTMVACDSSSSAQTALTHGTYYCYVQGTALRLANGPFPHRDLQHADGSEEVCTVDELKEAGWHQDSHGYWVDQ